MVQIHSPRPILIGPTTYRIRVHKSTVNERRRKTQELFTLNALAAPCVFPFHPKCSTIIVYADSDFFVCTAARLGQQKPLRRCVAATRHSLQFHELDQR